MSLGILKYLRRCPLCYRLFPRVEWLCLACLARVSEELTLKHRMIDSRIDHFYLLDWEKEDGLSPLVYSLKGGRCVWAFEFLSQYFRKLQSPRRRRLYYPSKEAKDHAFQLAHQLSLSQGLTPYPLIKSGQKKQSLLRRGERGRVHYLSERKECREALFVDDIVTTGSTAKAGFKALGQPKKMTVWSLFYRNYL